MFRTSLLTGTIVTGVALTLGATTPAALAETSAAPASDSVVAQTDWGINTDRWHVSITNNTGSTLTYSPFDSFGVKQAPAVLAPGQSGLVLGRSLLGPLKLFAVFSTPGGRNRAVQVSKSGAICGTHENGGLGNNNLYDGDRCVVDSGDLTQEIAVQFLP